MVHMQGATFFWIFLLFLSIVCLIKSNFLIDLAHLANADEGSGGIAHSLDLRWKHWGNDSELRIAPSQSLTHSIHSFRIEGQTGKSAAGFESQDLNYTGRYVLIGLGDSVKISKKDYPAKMNPFDFQVSFVFQVTGNKGNYSFSLVNGNLEVEGWIGQKHIEKITPYSLKLLNFEDLVASQGDEYRALKKITITMENISKLGTLEFAIKFYKNSEIETGIFRLIDSMENITRNQTTAR
jgi:hypothetical protein